LFTERADDLTPTSACHALCLQSNRGARSGLERRDFSDTMTVMLRSSLALCLVIGLCAACAEGGGVGGSENEGGGVPSDGGAGAGPSGPSSTTGNMQPPMGGDPSDGGSGGTPPMGGEGGGGPMPTCDFTAPEMCAGAEPLPAIAGDEGSPSATRSGHTNKWFKIHIEEQDASIGDEDLSYTVSLASPPGVVYSLKVYTGAEDGPADCNAGVANGVGNPPSVSASWDDDQGFGGEDDSKWLIIEITHVSGELCSSSDNWTLLVQGNT
jgi:hypothetical protein